MKRIKKNNFLPWFTDAHRTLVDVIQWLDSNGHSNTEIRSKVDVMLNFEKQLKQESEMELTKITYVGD